MMATAEAALAELRFRQVQVAARVGLVYIIQYLVQMLLMLAAEAVVVILTIQADWVVLAAAVQAQLVLQIQVLLILEVAVEAVEAMAETMQVVLADQVSQLFAIQIHLHWQQQQVHQT
jgi:hypothetical protein